MSYQTYSILAFLKNTLNGSAEIATTFFESGYNARRYAMRRALGDTRDYSTAQSRKRDEQRRLLRNYYQKIYELERDGLIFKSHQDKNNAMITITKEGIEKYNYLCTQGNTMMPYEYMKKKTNHPTIVIFDIPEKQKKKRDWLRGILKWLEFTMIQKSVWIGTNSIPDNLIKDLQDLKILEYVDFFEVRNKGTLPSKEA